MHTQSMLDVLGRQPRKRFDVAFALTCAANRFNSLKLPVLRAIPARTLNRIPDYPAKAGPF